MYEIRIIFALNWLVLKENYMFFLNERMPCWQKVGPFLQNISGSKKEEYQKMLAPKIVLPIKSLYKKIIFKNPSQFLTQQNNLESLNWATCVTSISKKYPNLAREEIHLFPCPFWIRFCPLIFFKNFQTFLEVKIDMNQVILTPCPAHWVL